MVNKLGKMLSILLIACLLLSMLPTAALAATPSKLYLKPNGNWKVDNARFGAYFFVGESYTWVSMSEYGGGYYVCDVPSGGYNMVIFCRMSPGSSNDWGNVWNQSNDLTIPTNGNNCYTVSEGAWSYGDGSWGSFSCPHSWSGGKCSYCATSCTHASHNTSGVCSTCGSSVSHSWNSGTVTKAATCTTAGTKTFTCSVCKGTKTESIAKLGHSYSAKVTAPTCTEKGYTTHTCSRCNDSYKDTYTNATGHSYSSKVTKAATCTADGVRTYTCSKCSASYTEAITKLGHSYSAKVTAPTCTAGGYTTHTCDTCGDSYTDAPTEATGHNWYGASCSACGIPREYYLFGYINGNNYACEEDSANLGEYKFVDGKLVVTFVYASYVAVKTGDNMSWYMTDGYPGDFVSSAKLYNTNVGIQADKLYVPGGVEVTFTLTTHGADDTISLSYTVNASTCTHQRHNQDGKCTACGGSVSHTWENGTCNHCGAVCGHSYSGAICTVCGVVREYYLFGFINGQDHGDGDMASDYKFIDGKLTITLAEDSYVAVKTSNMVFYMTDGYVTAKSATFYNTANGIASPDKMLLPGGTKVSLTLTLHPENDTLTLTYQVEDCQHWKHGTDGLCTVCGAAVSHDWDAGVCSHCGKSCSHSWSGGTCGICGVSCDHSYDSGKITTQPTCTGTGVKTFTCGTCGVTRTEVIAANGHSYKSAVTKPSCTAGGYTTYTCASCGHSYTGDTTPATGHSYDSGKITTQPTCTGAGVKTFTCGTCGHSYTQSVAALGHDYQSVVTEPTCEENGYTTHTCSRCAHSYTDSVTAPTGHSYDDGNVTTQPGCEAEGVITFCCVSCAHSYTQPVEAVGHSWQEGVCDTCGAVCDHTYVGESCSVCGHCRSYYLFGYINGNNYACEEDAENIGDYLFADGSLQVSFDSDSFVAVKTGDNLNWYMTDGWQDGLTSVTLYNNEIGIDANKLFVPGGVAVSFVLEVHEDDTLTLSYTLDTATCVHLKHNQEGKCVVCGVDCAHSWQDGSCHCGVVCGHSFDGDICQTCGFERGYYLFGFINGADYAYGDDGHNLGQYRFEGGLLTITLSEDSYVGVKDNLGHWYMTESYVTGKTALLLNTDLGVSEKILLPGGVTVVISIVYNEDDTVTLVYSVDPESCGHQAHDESGACLLCQKQVGHDFADGVCAGCGYVCTHRWQKGVCEDCAAVCDHSWAEGVCTTCGMVCDHSWAEGICSTCGMVCDHSWAEGVCSTCGMVCDHSWAEGICSACGVVCSHELVNGACTICGQTVLNQEYYIFGWINGGNYACEEDGGNLGIYKFDASGKITVTFGQNSYIGVKTGDNQRWYMTDGYVGDVTSATLYNTASGISADKFFIPGGVEVTITIVVNDDDTISISYTGDLCSHPGHNQDALCTECGQWIGHNWSNGKCSGCGKNCSHSWYDGTCGECGKVCSHSWKDGVCSVCGNGCWHSFNGATCTNCGYTKTYYLFGYINGGNYACEEDGGNLGTYKFVNGKLTVKFTQDSYIGVKTGDNMNWYMTDGYLGEVNSATLYKTDAGIDPNKLYVPGGVNVTFTLTVNNNDTLSIRYTAEVCYHNYHDKNGNCTYCGKWVGHRWSGTSCSGCGKVRTYYIFGYINGSNYACEEDGGNLGNYKFVNNSITVHFNSDSYIGVKNDDGGWYMTDGYLGNVTSATLYNTSAGINAEKLFIPGGCDVTIYITINSNDTISIRYVADICEHPSHNQSGNCTACGASVSHSYAGDTCTVCGATKAYYLFGWINGGNYACEENRDQAGNYKFVNGKLTVTFEQDSYIGIKTGDNASWYMTDGYLGQVTSATLYNTNAGISADKLFIPGGVEVTITMTVNGDDTISVSYTTDACEHPSHDGDGICSDCGEQVAHSFEQGVCGICGKNVVLLSHASLSIENEVFYNIYFQLEDPSLVPEEMGLLIFEKDLAADGTMDTAMEVLPGYVISGDAFGVRSSGVAARNLGDTIYFKVYIKLADGTIIYSEKASYSTARYAKNILRDSDDPQLKALVVALLNYGTAAQMYFEYNVDAPLNGFLTDEERALVEEYRGDMMDTLLRADSKKYGTFARTPGGYTRRYPSVSCEGAFSINYYFTPAFVPEGDMILYYWTLPDYLAVDVLTAENASGSIVMTARADGQYVVEYTDIAAKHMDQSLYVAGVYSYEGVQYSTGVLSYSLGAYCTESAVYDPDPLMVAVGQSAVAYGYYAKRFFQVLSYKEQYILADGTVLQPGDSMPEIPGDGDVYIVDGYTYKYGYIQEMVTDQEGNSSLQWVDAQLQGWSVAVNDRTQTDYSPLRTHISGMPLVSMRYTFADCTLMTSAPAIPETVTDMTCTFYGCAALTGEITVDAQLGEAADCEQACEFCAGEEPLTCEACIRCGAWANCFAGTTQPITLCGTGNRLAELAATAENGNVTVEVPEELPVEPPVEEE